MREKERTTVEVRNDKRESEGGKGRNRNESASRKCEITKKTPHRSL